ncbi:MAG: glycosyltransferase [Trueperaceae bacterium]|nr:MAG: glycosyltransferase [Trueperaceae bacterium]
MRIAFFTENFLPKIDGVVTRVVRTLEQLTALGHNALIFAPHNPPSHYAGHRIVRVPGVPFKPWYPEVFIGLPRPRLGREIDRFKPDIVHVVDPVIMGLWGTALAKQRNLPLLSSFHTDIPQYTKHLKLGFLSPLSQTFLRDVHNQAHLNLCTSQPMVNTARGLGIKRVRLWPKAVDTERYHPQNYSSSMRNRLTAGHPDEPLMLYVGRLSHEKRLDWLYAPITQLEGVRLAIVGSGPAERYLHRRFRNTATVFTGYLSGQDLAEAYASSDVFAFPSDTETLGFVAMEAMASGVPAVGARAGGIPDVIEHGKNGFVFTPGDLGEFTERLGELLFDRDLRVKLGQQARIDMQSWNWRAATETLVEFYQLAITIKKRYDPPSVL